MNRPLRCGWSMALVVIGAGLSLSSAAQGNPEAIMAEYEEQIDQARQAHAAAIEQAKQNILLAVHEANLQANETYDERNDLGRDPQPRS